MKTARLGVFETNSSSTHCVALMNADEHKKFMNEGAWYDFRDNTIVDPETVLAEFKAVLKKKHIQFEPTLEQFIDASDKYQLGDWSPFDAPKDSKEINDAFYEFVRYRNIYRMGDGTTKSTGNGEWYAVSFVFDME